MFFLILYPVFGVQLVDVCNYTNDAKDVDDTEDDPEENTVAKVNGDGFKRYGQRENEVGLDRTGGGVRMAILEKINLSEIVSKLVHQATPFSRD